MPSGAKKRKALKKKKEQEGAFGGTTSNNGHGNDEHGSQDEGESDGNLSSPGSQGNGESWTRELSPSPLSGLGKDTVNENTDVPQGQEVKGEDFTTLGRGTSHEVKNGVDKPLDTFSENVTHSTIKAASKEAGGSLEITPADDSVSEIVIINKSEQGASATDAGSVQLEEAKEGNNIPGTAAETSKSVKEPQVPESSEDKCLFPAGPPVARTSWLSCCGLFDVISGSER